jgi:hypothetical protein
MIGKQGRAVPAARVNRRHRPGHMKVLKGRAMEKWMCWSAIGVSGFLALLFLLDLFLKFPFAGQYKFLDILGLLSCGIVGYLGWDSLKDIR